MKELILGFFGLLLWILIVIEWIPWLLWFLPVATLLLYFVIKRPPWSFRRFFLSFCSAGVVTGMWALLLLNIIGPNLPPRLQQLLVIHIDPNSQPRQLGPYLLGGMTGAEFLGYIALVSVGGFSFLLIYIVLHVSSRVSDSRSKRVWALRLLTVAAISSSTLLVYFVAPGYWVLFAFISYLSGIGFIINGDDPLDEMEDWQDGKKRDLSA